MTALNDASPNGQSKTSKASKSSWTPSDEELMAWADGVAEPELASLIEEAMVSSEHIATRASAMMLTRAYVQQVNLQSSHGVVPSPLRENIEALVLAHEASHAPVPAPLIAPNKLASTPPSKATLKAGFSWASLWQSFNMPTAGAFATLALALGLGLLIGRQPIFEGNPKQVETKTNIVQALEVGRKVPESFSKALQSMASGTVTVAPDQTKMALVSSYKGPDGSLCREFALSAISGPQTEALACQQTDGSWRLEVANIKLESNTYQPASSQALVEAWALARGLKLISAAQEQQSGIGQTIQKP